MAEKLRITQRDVAREAGVDQSSVSLALKNHSSIPQATKQKIRDAALRLGYTPDPMLSALANYRTRLRPATLHGTVAWLYSSHNGKNKWWTDVPQFNEYYKGAKKAGSELGFHVEPFQLDEAGMTRTRLAGILKARNISSLLLCPQPRPNSSLDFPWQDFSVITFGYTLASPHFSLVTSSHYKATVLTIRKLIDLGYKRIGFSLSPTHNEKVDNAFLAAYYTELALHGLQHFPLESEWSDSDVLTDWIRKNRLEAIITGRYTGMKKLSELNIKIPEELGVACPSLGDRRLPVSGAVEDSFYIGEVALRMLSEQINRGEKGIPLKPISILVDAIWQEGETLRKIRDDKASYLLDPKTVWKTINDAKSE
ncbi:LacI family DNA-binding transcriptional regulator [Ruficoccus sp. ZRK36]|uniref:LacI family DNA-binding transcriptional regulator n=1 Tax=Ruficoccus sp. ZRK36 TaxID=2866311 RepID=UPI001C72DD87|nr:LacI family DNA-binding transcriptional regulator [Ruficoccus sp. ZRK36]QYY37265.1 LacI family transcriptional regulator [Ruficoccus sp. ZRK36]